jgi:hypothetical protein
MSHMPVWDYHMNANESVVHDLMAQAFKGALPEKTSERLIALYVTSTLMINAITFNRTDCNDTVAGWLVGWLVD